MTTQRFIPVSALHEQIAQREARLLEIDEEVVKLTRERASLEQEIKLHRDRAAPFASWFETRRYGRNEIISNEIRDGSP